MWTYPSLFNRLWMMPVWVVSSLLAPGNNTVEINKTGNVFLFMEVYLRGKFLQVRLLGQRVNTYAIALHVIKLPFVGGGHFALLPTTYETEAFFANNALGFPPVWETGEGISVALNLHFLYSGWGRASLPVFEDLCPALAMSSISCPFYLNLEELFKINEICPYDISC